ncbi:leucine dehydrogenase [Gemmobacter megaterium]|uniref:Leucine dehydrogenase n=1 Tax=Gemmobacter megaterium TaxID=1086013 RepID=A0A1N7N1Y4_9RHOB|nr:Glu/Leu/Phe/Val dehydrogenase dimerization domain-containing protein [Gemmobacter megaterium]GGE12572.1 amino acid dehydrogenase [Gemmobacter megaterium]SIS92386.1 leucine dehydrogenase [Gemmobacter megaterium]
MTQPEDIVDFHDPDTGLVGCIVLHSTALGPAAGGCRLWQYADPQAMRADAMRLAEGMSYKNALAGLPMGGGKAVIRRPPGHFNREALFRAFGRVVDGLGGRYITAEDVGTSVEDMLAVASSTRHVAGLPADGPGPGGDPSPWTAQGVFVSMRASVQRRLGTDLAGCVVAIQGLGHVGSALADLLHAAGARLVVADLSDAHVRQVAARTGARIVPPDRIHATEAHVFAPCALGAVIHAGTIPELRAKVICGAANNQLATPQDGARLAARDILYAPDYVVNAGGIINVAGEHLGWSADQTRSRVLETAGRLDQVFRFADTAGVAPDVAADELARAAIGAAAQIVQAPA